MPQDIHCLHIPQLYEDGDVCLTWEDRGSGADHYRVERRLDGDFTTEALGLTWASLMEPQPTWGDITSEDESWEAFMAHPTDLCVYEGTGETVPYPAPGYCWADVNDHWRSWGQLAAFDADWQALHNCAPRGLQWQDIDNADHDWAGIHGTGTDWQTLHGLLPEGMTWAGAHARYLPWSDVQAPEPTWADLHARTDRCAHRAMTDHIPVGAKLVAYRVTACDAQGGALAVIASWQHAVTPVYEREDELTWQVQRGGRYLVELDALDMCTFGGIPMTLTYDPAVLRPTDAAVQTAQPDVAAGQIPGTPLVIEQAGRGWLRVRCEQPIKNSETWTGLVTLCELEAVASGSAQLTLS